ncbi:hypothetical protein ACFLQI_02050 [Candidatus Undinarchaeota archaeon]
MKRWLFLAMVFLLLNPAMAVQEEFFIEVFPPVTKTVIVDFFFVDTITWIHEVVYLVLNETSRSEVTLAYEIADLQNINTNRDGLYKTDNILDQRHSTDKSAITAIRSFWTEIDDVESIRNTCQMKNNLLDILLHYRCFKKWTGELKKFTPKSDEILNQLSFLVSSDYADLKSSGVSEFDYGGGLLECASDLEELAAFLNESSKNPEKACSRKSYRSFTFKMSEMYCSSRNAETWSGKYNPLFSATSDSAAFLILNLHNKCTYIKIDEEFKIEEDIKKYEGQKTKLISRYEDIQYYCSLNSHNILTLRKPTTSNSNSIGLSLDKPKPSEIPLSICKETNTSISSLDALFSEVNNDPVFARKFAIRNQIGSTLDDANQQVTALSSTTSNLDNLAKSKTWQLISQIESIRSQMTEIELNDCDNRYRTILWHASQEDIYDYLIAIQKAEEFLQYFSPLNEKQESCKDQVDEIFQCVEGNLNVYSEKSYLKLVSHIPNESEAIYCGILGGSKYYKLRGIGNKAKDRYSDLNEKRAKIKKLSAFLASAELDYNTAGFSDFEKHFQTGSPDYLSAVCELNEMQKVYDEVYTTLSTTLDSNTKQILTNLIQSSTEYTLEHEIFSDSLSDITLTFRITNSLGTSLPPTTVEIGVPYPIDGVESDEIDAWVSGDKIRIILPEIEPGKTFEPSLILKSDLLTSHGEECHLAPAGQGDLLTCELYYTYNGIESDANTERSLFLDIDDGSYAEYFESSSNPGYIWTSIRAKQSKFVALIESQNSTIEEEILENAEEIVEFAEEHVEEIETKNEITGQDGSEALEDLTKAKEELEKENLELAKELAKKTLDTKVFDTELKKQLNSEKQEMKGKIEFLNKISSILYANKMANKEIDTGTKELGTILTSFSNAIKKEDIKKVADSREQFNKKHNETYSIASSTATQLNKKLMNQTKDPRDLMDKIEKINLDSICSMNVKQEIALWAKDKEYSQIKERLRQSRDYALGTVNGQLDKIPKLSDDELQKLVFYNSIQKDTSAAESFFSKVQVLNETAKSSVEGTDLLLKRGLLKRNADTIHTSAIESYENGHYIEAIIYADYISSEKKSTPKSILYTLLTAPILFIPGAYLSRKKLKQLFRKKPKDEITSIEEQLRKFK